MKVTRHETDSPAVTQAAPQPDTVVDKLGRVLTLKEPDILAESRLVRLVGDAAMNHAYMIAYVTPAAMVIAINGESQSFPQSELELNAAIQRLGREGQTAVLSYLNAKAKASQEAEQDAAKK